MYTDESAVTFCKRAAQRVHSMVCHARHARGRKEHIRASPFPSRALRCALQRPLIPHSVFYGARTHHLLLSMQQRCSRVRKLLLCPMQPFQVVECAQLCDVGPETSAGMGLHLLPIVHGAVHTHSVRCSAVTSTRPMGLQRGRCSPRLNGVCLGSSCARWAMQGCTGM